MNLFHKHIHGPKSVFESHVLKCVMKIKHRKRTACKLGRGGGGEYNSESKTLTPLIHHASGSIVWLINVTLCSLFYEHDMMLRVFHKIHTYHIREWLSKWAEKWLFWQTFGTMKFSFFFSAFLLKKASNCVTRKIGFFSRKIVYFLRVKGRERKFHVVPKSKVALLCLSCMMDLWHSKKLPFDCIAWENCPDVCMKGRKILLFYRKRSSSVWVHLFLFSFHCFLRSVMKVFIFVLNFMLVSPRWWKNIHRTTRKARKTFSFS